MALCKTIDEHSERHVAANAPFQSTGMGHRAIVMSLDQLEIAPTNAHFAE